MPINSWQPRMSEGLCISLQLDQMAEQERHRQAMRDAQAAVDRAANTSALMGQACRVPPLWHFAIQNMQVLKL